MKFENIEIASEGLEGEVAARYLAQLEKESLPLHAAGTSDVNILQLGFAYGSDEAIILTPIRGAVSYTGFEDLDLYTPRFTVWPESPNPNIHLNPSSQLLGEGAKPIVLYGNNINPQE
jgi:hypothetical protein